MPVEADLSRRLDALVRAVDLGGRWLPEDAVRPATEVVDRVGGRLRHGTQHTVVALAGPTGSGKSSLYNALTGREFSSTGVRRPTTGETHAAVWGEDAGPLLDWLGIRRRHVVDHAEARREGLVLLDLPDHDSTAVEHRMEVDRLVELVDLMIWVVDPQKYADQSLHDRYLRRLAPFGPIMRFVLTKADTMTDEETAVCVDDLTGRIRQDGITDPDVLAVSVVGERGIAELWAAIEKTVEQRRAALERAEIELHAVAAALPGVAHGGDAELSRRVRRRLVEDLSRSAGVGAVAEAAARQYRREAAAAVGWPPLRWLGRFRRSPLADLPTVDRSAVGAAGVGSALRAVGEAVGERLDPTWGTAARATAVGRREELIAALADLTMAGPRRPRRPWWWRAGHRVQAALIGVAAVGLAWLVGLVAVEALLRIDVDPLAPEMGAVPLPTLLFVGGLLAGAILAVGARVVARAGGVRRAGIVRRSLRREILIVADAHVTAPLEALVLDRRAFVSSASEAMQA